MSKRPKISRIPSREERAARAAERAKRPANVQKGMVTKRLNKVAKLEEARNAKKLEPQITLVAYITTTDDEIIKIGPFKKREIVIRHRFVMTRILKKQGRAREIDLLWLELYEQGYFDERENSNPLTDK